VKRFRFRSVSAPARGLGLHSSASTNAAGRGSDGLVVYIDARAVGPDVVQKCSHGSYDRCTIVPIACSLTCSFGHRFECVFQSGSPDWLADMWWSEE